MVTNYENYRKEKTQKGMEYQDFIQRWFAKNMGLNFTIFSSKKYQNEYGESLQGIEIKYDMLYEKTGNIYIETGEKAQPRDGNYYQSGIYREDNTWLYIIGNYEKCYVFSKKQLRTIFEKGIYYKKIENNNTMTSTGFLLNEKMCERYCLLKINFNNE